MFLGLTITGLGIVMVLLSLREEKDEERIRHGTMGVIFIGPIPIVFGGRGKLILVGIAIAVVISLLLMVIASQSALIGW